MEPVSSLPKPHLFQHPLSESAAVITSPHPVFTVLGDFTCEHAGVTEASAECGQCGQPRASSHEASNRRQR